MRRGSAEPDSDWPERPDGPLVWIHVARADRLPAILQLASRLIAQRPGTHVLLTAGREVAGPRRLKAGVIWCAMRARTLEEAQAFVTHFHPDVGVWTSGDFDAALLDATAAQGITLLLIDAVEDGLGKRGLAGLSAPTRSLLGLFSAYLASDDAAAARLAWLGVPQNDIEVTGPLQEGSAALPCRESDLTELSTSIGPRPVWLAAMVQPEEIVTVLRAHRASTRFSQRLMLILVPDSPDMADEVIAQCKQDALRFVQWSEGELPDEQTEVIVADTIGEMGLWYRLASVSFMGSSLISGKGGCDPFEPAALGSAVLYGPNCGRHLQAYSRLVSVGAARMVRDTDSLVAALRHLTAPDHTAAMALAAWELVSEGAEVSDRVTDLVQDYLDLAESL